MPTIFSSSYPFAPITSWPELCLWKWCRSNLQSLWTNRILLTYNSRLIDIHWTIVFRTIYLFVPFNILLCIMLKCPYPTGHRWCKLRITIYRGDISCWHALSEYVERIALYIWTRWLYNQPLWEHSRVAGDDVVEGYVPCCHWCGDSAGYWLMKLIPWPPDILIEWYLVTLEEWIFLKV